MNLKAFAAEDKADLEQATGVKLWAPREGPPPPTHRYDALILSDHQAPWIDKTLHGLACDYIREVRPTIGIVNGDLVNLDAVGTHRKNWTEALQDSINVGYSVLSDYRWACPETTWYFIPGNHEERLRKYIQDHAPALEGIHAAGVSDSILTTAHLLRLGDLGVTLVTSIFGDWPWAQFPLTRDLVVLHGIFARSSPGASARATVDRLGCSCIVGHTHKQAIVNVIQSHRPTPLIGVESGTMSQKAGGLGYVGLPSAANGFTHATIFEDESFAVKNITYIPGSRRLQVA